MKQINKDSQCLLISKLKGVLRDEYIASKQYAIDSIIYPSMYKSKEVKNELNIHSKEEANHAKLLISILEGTYHIFDYPKDETQNLKKSIGCNRALILLNNLCDELKAVHDYKWLLKNINNENKDVIKGILDDEKEHAADLLPLFYQIIIWSFNE